MTKTVILGIIAAIALTSALIFGAASVQQAEAGLKDPGELVRCSGERVSVTVAFHDNYKLDKEGKVGVLLDTTGSGTLCVVHVAANLQCNDDNPPNSGAGNDTPDIRILAGVAGGTLSPVIFSTAEDTGFEGTDETCVFHATVIAADLGHDITDIIMQNIGADDVAMDPTVITITGRMTDESVVPPAVPGSPRCTCEPEQPIQRLVCFEDCEANKVTHCTEVCEANGLQFVDATCQVSKICREIPK